MNSKCNSIKSTCVEHQSLNDSDFCKACNISMTASSRIIKPDLDNSAKKDSSALCISNEAAQESQQLVEQPPKKLPKKRKKILGKNNLPADKRKTDKNPLPYIININIYDNKIIKNISSPTKNENWWGKMLIVAKWIFELSKYC